jgi:hypothetical protein
LALKLCQRQFPNSLEQTFRFAKQEKLLLFYVLIKGLRKMLRSKKASFPQAFLSQKKRLPKAFFLQKEMLRVKNPFGLFFKR